MSGSESEFDPVGLIADEYAARLRRGERPSIDEYAARHPELSERIRTVFSALEFVETLRPSSDSVERFPDRSSAAPPRRDQARSSIADYRIVREIGRGGMGVVYEAEQQSLHRRVALKLLRGSLARDGKARERFRRESRMAAQLHHTNIVPVYEVGETDDSFFYVMQLISGRGLDRIIDELNRMHDDQTGRIADLTSPEPLSSAARAGGLKYWRHVARIGVQAAEALQYAHERNLLHRDIKPSNLLLDADGTVWITDFGLAKAGDCEGDKLDELTETGDIVGTIRYMPPERLRGINDPRSDIYGLGMTLYEVLALQPAFRGSDRLNLLQQIVHVDPPRPSSIDRRIPRDLETIVLKACHKEPGRRYRTAAEMGDDLRRYLELRPILARDSSATERAWWWCRRNPAIAGSLVAVAALLVLVAAGATATAFYLSITLEQSEEHRRSAEAATRMAARERQRTEAAEGERTEQLWSSLRNQANALFLSGRPGQRHQGLVAIQQAAAIRPSLELRNAAITCMTLPDLDTGNVNWLASPEDLEAGWQVLAAGTDGLNAREVQPGVIAISDCVTGREVERLMGCLSPVQAGFSSDCTFLVLQAAPVTNGSTDAQVEVWDWRLKRRIVQLMGDPSFGFAFRADRTQCVLGNANGELVFFNLPEGTEHHRAQMVFRPGSQRLCIYTPDGAQLITFLRSTLTIQFIDARSTQLVDVRSGRGFIRSFTTPSELMGIAVSHDGRFLAAGCINRQAYVWDLTTGKRIRDLVGHQADVTRLWFVPGTAALVTSGWDKSARYWDLPTGQTLLRLSIGPRPKFDTDSARWVSDINSLLSVQSLTTSREFRTLLGHTEGKGPTDVNFHPQGRLLATAGLDGVRLWDVVEGSELGLLPGHFVSAHFTPDGCNLLASGSDGVFCWPIRSDDTSPQTHIGLPTQIADKSSERRSSLTPDGTWLAVTDRSRNLVELFHVSTLERTRTFSGIEQVAFALPSPDGRWCVGGTWPEHQFAIWDARSGELVQRIEVDGPPNAAFNPSGTRLVVNGRNHGRVYSVPDWSLEAELPRHSAGGFGPPFYSPDGRILALTRNSYQIQLLDSGTWTELATLDTTQPYIASILAFSPDGSLLVAASGTNAVIIWDLRLIREQLADLNLDWAQPDFPSGQRLPAEHREIVIERPRVLEPAGTRSMME